MSKTIGIFFGKKSTYNQMILKSLSTGDKNTWQIAENIYQNDPKRKKELLGKIIPRNEVKKINKTICWKNGRLKELEKKEYIKKENGLWTLTKKGGAVTLTLFDNLDFLTPAIEAVDLTDTIQKMKDFFKQLTIGNFLLKDKGFQALFKAMENKKFLPLTYQMIRNFTNKLIKSGVNLDNISEKEFTRLEANHISHLLVQMAMKEFTGKSEEDQENLKIFNAMLNLTFP